MQIISVGGLLDEESDIYVDGVRGTSFDAGSVYFDYIYDADTKQYIIVWRPQSGPQQYRSYHFEGYLNDEGGFVVTYYEQDDFDAYVDKYGRDAIATINIPSGNFFDRHEEKYPGVADVVLDDIEWVYVTYE